jgi:integrase
MAKRGAPGLSFQINRILKTLDGTGLSKRSARKLYQKQQSNLLPGERSNIHSPFLHSAVYQKHCAETWKRYLEFARSKGDGARFIKDFNHQAAGKKYLEWRCQTGIRNIRSEVSHLRQLENGVKKTFATEINIVPQNVVSIISSYGIPLNKRERLANRLGFKHFSEKELEQVMQAVRSQRSGQEKEYLLRSQYLCGLRIKEACSLRVCNINLSGDTWVYHHRQSDGSVLTLRVPSGHILLNQGTKGNKPRVVPCGDITFWQKLCDGRSHNELVFTVKGARVDNRIRNIQKSFRKACLENSIAETRTHNLRATYAQREYDRLREDHTERRAKEIITERLGHKDTSKLQHYIV